ARPACADSPPPTPVLVSGATTIDMPSPSVTTAGKNAAQYDPPIPARANSSSPAAEMIGPTVSGSRLPTRATNPPDQRDSRNISSGNGSSEAPAAVAE